MTRPPSSDIHSGGLCSADVPMVGDDPACQLVGELSEILLNVLAKDESLRHRLAAALVDGLRSRLGGSDVYIPAPDKSARNAAIRSEFNGTNMREVCRRHDVGPTTVYRIVGARSVGSTAR